MQKHNETILSFEDLSFEFGHNKPILNEVNFSIRRGAKMTLMGQNGSGKSTIFNLITHHYKPESGKMHIGQGISIAIAKQVIPRSDIHFTVRQFFENCFDKKMYDIEPKIEKILDVVNLKAPLEREVGTFSGGQQARLLLASALIQNPDLLLLDEPTNNLDKEGIAHLTKFLVEYEKTCIVISHDADFLNAFTHGVLYLDIHTKKIEQYVGNYFDVVEQISARIEKENMKNAQLAKEIQENKEKANFFAMKGGQMRLVAKRMREKAEELEEEKVDVRTEDRTIRKFTIPGQPEVIGEIVHISKFSIFKNHKKVARKVNLSLKRNQHLLLTGPNGIGKSTLLEALATHKAKGTKINPSIRVGYYRQDFSTLNFEDTIFKSLMEVMDKDIEQEMRSVAAGFLITGDMIYTKIGSLSEGQKGLVALARLVLQKPGLLILDEPTNHINFRHLPVIAKALSEYQGAMILVSHVPEFVKQIRIDEVFDLEK
ncbi:MAG: ABC-F family ATP-binding cassette domain-containing protein [Candidatus Paceibacterota bacterium]|jgi:ATPase subunit of ABC transporter with duplicated ATPase domains